MTVVEGGEKMQKIIAGIVGFVVMLMLPVVVYAQMPVHTLPHDLAHAYTPMIMNNAQNMPIARAKVMNWLSMPIERTVCVDAHPSAGGKMNLGCLKLNFPVGGWHEFDTPLSLGMGTYTIVYSYQKPDGTWHQVTNTADNLVPVTVTK